MVMFLVLHPMESISLNSFVLLEHLAMLLTSTLAINCYLRNFLNKAIGIINLNAFYWYQIFALDSAVVEVQEMFSSHGGHLTNAKYHHGETL